MNIIIKKYQGDYFARIKEIGHAVVGDGDTMEVAVFNCLLCYQLYIITHPEYKEEDYL